MFGINDFDEMMKQRKNVANTNIVYFNDKDEIVDKEKATKFIISEYDKTGNVINKIFGTCAKNKNENFEVEEK